MPDRKCVICPECHKQNVLIKSKQLEAKILASQTDEEDSEEEVQPIPKIKQFDNWIDYAYHIIESHTDSERVLWALTTLGLPPETRLPYKKVANESYDAVSKRLQAIEQEKEAAKALIIIPAKKPLFRKINFKFKMPFKITANH